MVDHTDSISSGAGRGALGEGAHICVIYSYIHDIYMRSVHDIHTLKMGVGAELFALIARLDMLRFGLVWRFDTGAGGHFTIHSRITFNHRG